jgi:hypothetical protein
MLSPDTSPLPVLTAATLVQQIRDTFRCFPDVRKGGNNQRYTLEDAALSAFAVFFTQSPSFLDYQVRMQKERGRNNADSLFGVHKIPSTTQIVNLLDPVSPSHVFPLFIDTVEALHRLGELDAYRSIGGNLLIPLDGTEYFRSESISCPQCSSRTLKNGHTQYYHTAITPVIVAPGQEAVFPLPAEFILPQDGHDKQDCELAAAGRWLVQWGPRVSSWKVTLLGDDLYCHQPFCEQVLAQGVHFLFVCLPDSHSTLYEWVADFARNEEVPTFVKTRWDGRRHLTDTYRYLNHLPLRNTDDALLVGWCELTTTDPSGKILYRNAWATSHPVTADNVVELVKAGRSRWKIENENNNTLKTKGYHFDHNYGHGQQHLSTLLATLILLAYLVHTVLDRLDPAYRAVRERLPSRRTFFEHLRALVQYLPFDSWDQLFAFMIEALQPVATRTKALPRAG